jgi:predicted enzyme related to lactoylglutathione lyase
MKNDSMIIIGVNDLDESIAFYQTYLHCTLIKRVNPGPDVEIGFVLYNDALEIELIHRRDQPPVTNKESTVTVAFASRDINADYELLQKNNVRCLGEPVALPSGVRMFRFLDPNGTTLSFMEE